MPTIANVESEVAFISGVTSDGHLSPMSYGAWNGDRPATYNTVFTPAVKWFGDASDSHAGSTGGVVTYAFDPASNWSLVERNAFKAGLALWSAVANISFAEVGNLASAELDFTRGNDGQAHTQGTYAFPTGAGAAGGTTLVQLTSATLSVDTSVAGFGPITDSTSVYGGYVWNTILHEEGHALGLGHGGPYNGNVIPNTDQFSLYDTTQYSIMSYVSGANPNNNKYNNFFTDPIPNWGTTYYAGADYYNVPTTWMPVDILAAQRLYGIATTTPLSGGQVFGFNSNITGDLGHFFDFSKNSIPILTLWDVGQNNTLDLTGFSAASTVDLHSGSYSSVNGMVGNIAIAFDTAIDTLRTGAGNDTITGNDDGNYIDAGAGDDTITGGAGNDVIIGGFGNNTINGGGGINTLFIDDVSAHYSNYHDLAQTVITNGTIALNSFGQFGSVSNATKTDTATNIQSVQFLDKKFGFLPIFNSSSYQMDIDPKVFPRTVFTRPATDGFNDLYLLGASSDTVIMDNGTNFVLPGGGTDIITGGTGIDTVMFARSAGSYIVTKNANGSIQVKAPGVDVTMTGVEFALLDVDTKALAVGQSQANAVASNYLWQQTPISIADFQAQSFAPLNYIASYGDLIRAFGDNQAAGLNHFLSNGFNEGRSATFNALDYTASYGDLIQAFGNNQTAALEHYIQNGFGEGRRASFNALGYIASYGDLIHAFGDNTQAALNHYVSQGFKEGRTANFDALAYIASYTDLLKAYGGNVNGALDQYITMGYSQGRTITFNAQNYIASYGDLIRAFGENQQAALGHYDVQGFNEGRIVSFDPVSYLLSYSDLERAGLTAKTAATHFIDFGYYEGRSASGSFGAEQTQHALTSGIEIDDSLTAGDKDWFSIDLHAGQQFSLTVSNFDASAGLPDIKVVQANSNGLPLIGFDTNIPTTTGIYTATQTGTMYLEVSSNSPSAFGRYGIQVQAM